ncbi:ParB N-terminal domain-containing protein [Methylosinus sp. Sm6]|uniref:ParB/RepB/Spo0J family partition protein n=1 Tax=Methylosinus sp. Sm6 TaxID=2866948 RepID=UPI001C99E2D9|nr:ParB N-terminal domain-containing protein [Methylosinus sp. Sm6]
MAEPLRIPLFEIESSNRLRPVDPDWAAAIAGSIAAKGLDQPITIRRKGNGYQLVIGGHRLHAFGILGLEELIEGVHFKLVEQSDDQAELSEIDENLMRRELSAVDRAIFLARRKSVWDRVYPETTAGGDRKSQKAKEKIKRTTCPFVPETFSKDAAAKTGLSDRTIRRSIALANVVPREVVELIRPTKLADNAAQLRQLGRETPENQLLIARAICAGGGKSISHARQILGLAKPSEHDPHTQIANKLLALWNRSSPRARETFLEAIGLGEAEAEETEAA